MNISKRKVVSLAKHEVELINKVISLLYDLDSELEDEYDYSDLIKELEYIQCKEYVLEDESHD